MRISRRSIEEVREAVDITEVASEFTALRRQGARFTGLCPYPDHSEKTPSFSVSAEQGFYYCFGCLEENERIWTSRGLIPIAEAEIGDQVIGLDGRRESITDKVTKSGSTVKIKTGAAKEGIELTPDHWCIFVKKSEAMRAIPRVHLRARDGEQLRFSSKLRPSKGEGEFTVDRASNVRPEDFWLYPVIPDGERTDSPLSGERVIKVYTKGPRSERIPELHVNEDTAWLLGVWLAEGSLYRGGVKWSFGAHESGTLAPRVVRILDEEFGRPATIGTRLERNLSEVTCSSTDLAALFEHWFGRGCANKRVPTEALSWTSACQEALIEGYMAGDGHTCQKITSATTVSEALAYGIFALCIQARKVCSISATPEFVGKDGTKHRKFHTVSLLCKESLRGFFAPIAGTAYYWSMVRDVEIAREEPTRVVDITTTGSHTFLTKMGTTHNCQRGGDAIKLVGDLKSFSFSEAVSYLAERSNVELEFEGSPADAEAAKKSHNRRRTIHKALAAAAVYYHKVLLKSQSQEAKDARDYLEKRDIRLSTIEEFRLGYAPPRGFGELRRVASKLGVDGRMLEAAGLVSGRGGERFAGRVTFPISDRRGRMVGFGARALGDDHPKYLNSPETEVFDKRNLLYGFPQVAEGIRKERAAVIVEGYTDVLMLHQAGIKNAVATLGTATTPAHLKTLSGYADKIYVLFDPDAAGDKAMERAAVAAAELGLDLQVAAHEAAWEALAATTKARKVRLTKDPADWVSEHSAEEFREILRRSEPASHYVVRKKAEQVRGSDAATRSRVLREIVDFIAQIQDPVFRREAMRLATQVLDIDFETLRTMVDRQTARNKTNAPANALASAIGSDGARTEALDTRDPLQQAGRDVLALIIARPDLTAALMEGGATAPELSEPFVLMPHDFGEEGQSRLYALLVRHAGEDLDSLLSDEEARPFMDRIAHLASLGERLYPNEASVREAWFRLGVLSRQRSMREAPDYDAKERLREEAQALTRALRSAAVRP